MLWGQEGALAGESRGSGAAGDGCLDTVHRGGGWLGAWGQLRATHGCWPKGGRSEGPGWGHTGLAQAVGGSGNRARQGDTVLRGRVGGKHMGPHKARLPQGRAGLPWGPQYCGGWEELGGSSRAGGDWPGALWG